MLFILYLLLAVLFLRGVIFLPGIISGGDWGLPLTSSQMFRYFERGFFTWSEGSLFGNEQFFLNSLPFHIIIGFLAKLGMTGDIYTKLFLILAFVLAAFNMFLLCRFLNCSKKVAIFGGFLYITLPFFFNYAAMGWLFVLLSMGILPLTVIFFIKSIKEEKISFSILTGLLYFLATVQSQTIIWYPFVFLSLSFFLINDKKKLFIYLKSLLIIFLVFITLSSFWLLPLFLGGGSGILNTKLGLSSVSLGTWGRLSYQNIFRGWGSLYNFQYETSYLHTKLLIISFFLPFLAYSSLFFLKKNKLVYSLVLLSLVPLAFFKLGPSIVVKLPFSDLFRDVARFLVLSSFAYVVLATLVLDFLFKNKHWKLKIVGTIAVAILIVSTFPFITGKISGKDTEGFDIRLRTYKFIPEDFALEDKLKDEKADIKVLYLPIGSGLNLINDKRFDGLYSGIRDIFAAYSPNSGLSGISDKGTGGATGLIFELQTRINNQQLSYSSNSFNLMNIKYIAVRKNVDYPLNFSGEGISNLLVKKTNMALLNEWEGITLFKNNNFLPHFYIPQNIIYSNGNISNLVDAMSFNERGNRTGFYFNDSKTKDSTNLMKENEIFIKTDLNNSAAKDFFNKKEEFKRNTPFPFVKYKPESFRWKLAKLKEKYSKWRVKDNTEEALNKKLFYASKIISELEKFGINEQNNELVKLKSEEYQIKMKEIIQEIKQLKNSDVSDSLAIELSAYSEMHKEKIEEIMGNLKESDDKKEVLKLMNDIFIQFNNEVKSFEKKFDWQNLEYTFEVPEKGEYGFLVKKENNSQFLLNSTKVNLNDKAVLMKLVNSGEKEWLSFGKSNFKEGEHKIIFSLPGIKNLVNNNWFLENTDIKDKKINFYNQNFLYLGKDIISQSINDWQENTSYYLSFDYQTDKGSLGMMISEDKLENQDNEEVIQAEKIFEKVLRTSNITLGDNSGWHKFEALVDSDFKSFGGKISFWSTFESNQSADVRIRNLKIYKINQPQVILYKQAIKVENDYSPKITFIKVNPTKYRVKIEGAADPYTITFSESFHQGWKAYINQNQNSYGEETASYFNGEIKEGTHKNIFLDRNTFETLGKKPIPEKQHLLINGYANSWYVTPEDTNGAENYEIIIEFWPQRLFYVGLIVFLVVIIIVFTYLFYILRRKLKNIKNQKAS